MPHQTNHDEQSHDHVPLAAAFDPQPASRPSTANSSVEFTDASPRRQHQQPAQRAQLPGDKRSRRRSRITDDERRLVGDYSTPADAVMMPDPQTWNMAQSRPDATMHKKPGSSSSFKPLNTIDAVNHGAKTTKPKTYSKLDRLHDPLIGRERHAGQIAYVENQRKKMLTSPHQRKPSQQSHSHGQRLESASPYKRRKIMQEAVEVIDDDPVESRPSSAQRMQTLCATHEMSCSTQSSLSQRSFGSACPSTARKSGSPQQSAFKTTNSFVDPHRKKRRDTGGIDVQGTQHPRQESQRKLPQSGTFNVQEDGCVDQLGARKQILNHFQQGVSNGPSESERQSSRSHSPESTSHYFPSKARINESTAEVEHQVMDPRHKDHRSSACLRHKFRRVENATVESKDDPIDSSEDELTRDTTKPETRKKLASRATQTLNSIPSKGWSLNFARTYEFEHQGPVLFLKRGKGAKSYRVIGQDAEGNLRTLHEGFSFDRVNKLWTDDVSRIRLEGARRPDGNPFVYDLEFTNVEDLVFFSGNIAEPECQRKYSKDQSHLKAIFEKPLARNNKVGQSPLANEDTHVQSRQEQANGQHQGLKTTLWDQLKQTSTVKSASRQHDMNKAAQSSGRGSTQSIRSTRSSAPTYTLEDGQDVRKDEVHKYSIVEGLGPRWHKSLSYGSGRQRSEVHQSDLARLDDDEMLNDNLVDFYLSYLFDKYQVPPEKVYMWNTFFFPTLTQNTGRNHINYKAVERWTGKADMFSYDYIVVPINESFHWYLAIICNVSNIDRAPVIENFDKDFPEPMNEVAEHVLGQEIGRENEVGNLPKSIDASRQATPAPETPIEPADDDVNLFDESSRLDLVNPDDTGMKRNSSTTVDQNKLARSPPLAEAAQAAHVATDLNVSFPIDSSTSNATTAKKKGKFKVRPQKKDPNQPVIIILDSLGLTRTGTTRALKEWLREEGKTKRGMEAEIKEKGYYPKEPLIPTQNNLTDCGIYLLGYAEKFFRNPDEFKDKLLTGEMTTETDWPDMKPTEMRNTMRQTLFELADQQRVRNKAARRAKKMAEKPRAATSSDKLETVRVNTVEPQDGKQEVEKAEVPTMGVAESHSPTKETVEANEIPSIVPQTARLSSPIVFTRQTAESAIHVQPSEEVCVSKVTDSPPIASSPNKRSSMTPRATVTPRKLHPEIRVPVKIAQSHTTNGGGPAASMQRSSEGSFSSSPSKMLEHDGLHDEASRVSPKALLTAKPLQRGAGLSSPAAPKARTGSSMAPIEIEDSQETSPKLATNVTFGNDTTSLSIQRKSLPKPHGQLLRHSSSVVEVAPPSRSPNLDRKQRQISKDVPGHGLEEQLLEAIHDRDGASKEQPITLDRAQEADADFDVMEIDGPEVVEQDADMMQIDMTDAQDAVVLETPERRRSSPPAVEDEGVWQVAGGGYVLRRV